MKKIFIIFSLLLGSTTLFCQIRADGIVELQIDRQNIPYKIAPVSSSARDGEIWRPLKGYYYLQVKSEDPMEEYDIRYDAKGVLQQENVKYYGESLIRVSAIYNQTFTKEGFDFYDTITFYQTLPGTDHIPTSRRYCDYHYYDRYPQDSFYYIEYIESWNNITQEWEKRQKLYQSYFDTTLFVQREFVYSNYVNGEWIKTSGAGVRILPEYNEDGRVSAHIIQYVASTGEYEMYRKDEFVYNEENVHIGTYFYEPNANDWKLKYKHTDIEYAEWYPNGQAGITFLYTGLEYLGLANKRVKMTSRTVWQLNDDNEWELYYLNKHAWDINGTKSHIDTLYQFYDEAWHFRERSGFLYDERGDCIQNLTEIVRTDGTYYGSKKCFLTSYHPTHDYPESFYRYELLYKASTQSWDSIFLELTTYFDWWDVTQPVSITESEPSGSAALSIFPNPVSGMVIIAAESEIEQLSIFDITGRLIANPLPTGERVVFDTGVLPQGVYMVRALLRDGEVKRGKIVVAR